jgi:hypothetical protein
MGSWKACAGILAALGALLVCFGCQELQHRPGTGQLKFTLAAPTPPDPAKGGALAAPADRSPQAALPNFSACFGAQYSTLLSDISVRGTVTGPDMAPVVGAGHGTVTSDGLTVTATGIAAVDVPAGSNRTLVLETLDANTGAVDCGATVTGITVIPDATTDVGTVLLLGVGKLQFTLTWSIPGDMDLHVFTPAGFEIYFSQPSSPDGGILDHDDTSGTGPENIYWPNSKTPTDGTYYVCAVDFGINAPVNFTVKVSQLGNVLFTFTGSRSVANPTNCTGPGPDTVATVTVTGNTITFP